MKSDSIQAEMDRQTKQPENDEGLDEWGNQPIPDEPVYHENRMQRRARERAERKQMNKVKGMK
jgi:hypothetical protein